MSAHAVRLVLCDQCLDGAGGLCNNPDCALCRNRAPDLPFRDLVEFIPPLPELWRNKHGVLYEVIERFCDGDLLTLRRYLADGPIFTGMELWYMREHYERVTSPPALELLDERRFRVTYLTGDVAFFAAHGRSLEAMWLGFGVSRPASIVEEHRAVTAWEAVS